MSGSPDLEALGLLDGLDGDARDQRVALLRWLLEQGFTVEQLQDATSPMLLLAERAIGRGERLSLTDVAERSGLPVDLLVDLARAQGIPAPEDHEARVLTSQDAEVARLAAGFIAAGIAPEHVLAVSRVLGDGLAQAAEVMRQTALATVLRPGATELELAQAYGAVAEQVAPQLGPMVEQLLKLHLLHMVETEALSAAELRAGSLPGAREVTIAFGDLVGFTRMGEQLDPDALRGVAARLAELARDAAAPPVRFVKTIGDAVMLVSPDPEALLRCAFALVDAVDAEPEGFPQLRVGLATGPAVSQAGDWYGHPVNLASRITSLARPGSVLVDPATEDRLSGADVVRFSFAGERRVKGVQGGVKLFRARPAAAS